VKDFNSPPQDGDRGTGPKERRHVGYPLSKARGAVNPDGFGNRRDGQVRGCLRRLLLTQGSPRTKLLVRGKIHDVELPIITSIPLSNELQVVGGVQMIVDKGNRKIGILGFSFKAGMDDLRRAQLLK
jgi:hypothetical protein